MTMDLFMKYGNRGTRLDDIMAKLTNEEWKNNKIINISVGYDPQKFHEIIFNAQTPSGKFISLKCQSNVKGAGFWTDLYKHWENIYLAGLKFDDLAIARRTRITVWRRRIRAACVLARRGLGFDLIRYFFEFVHPRINGLV